MATFPVVRHISVSVDRRPADVYAFVANPENLPLWAAGLGRSIAYLDGDWVADSPMGRVKIRFANDNGLGVLDHDVTLESGETIRNPMRVVANADGSEVVFTLFRRTAVSDDAFEDDARAVEQDLAELKRVLEAP